MTAQFQGTLILPNRLLGVQVATQRVEALNRMVCVMVGAVSTAFGRSMVVDIGFGQGCFLG